MSWWNSIHDLTGDISKGAEGVGRVYKNVGHAIAPVVRNPLVDAALAAGGQMIGIPAPLTYGVLQAAGTAMTPGQNIGGALKAGAIGGAEAYGAGKIAGMIPGLPSWAGGSGGSGGSAPLDTVGVPMADPSSVGGLSGVVGGDPTITGAPTVPGAGAPTTAPAVGAGSPPTGGGFPWMKALQTGLGVAQGVNSAMLSKKSTDYAKNALGTQQALFNSTAPLRTAGINTLTNMNQMSPWARAGTATAPQAATSWG